MLVLIKHINRRLSFELNVACIRVNRVMMTLVSLCAEAMKPVSDGVKNMTAVGGISSVYLVYPLCRTTGEGRAGVC